MANTRQAKKRILQTAARTLRNKAKRSRIRTFVTRVEQALQAGEAQAAQKAFDEAMPEIHRGVHKGILPANRAARKLSRLSKRVKLLKQA